MNRWRLIVSGLRYYWRTNLGVVLGAAVATMVLVGALVVGDSVDYTLRSIALQRIGDVHLSMVTQDRFFRAALAEEVSGRLGAPAAAVAVVDGRARVDALDEPWVNGVQVLGVDAAFFGLSGGGSPVETIGEDEVWVNERLALQLGVKKGSEIRLQVTRPSALPREAALASDDNTSADVPLVVAGVLGDDEFGRFSLAANQTAPLNLFVARSRLMAIAGIAGGDRANLMLVGKGERKEVGPRIGEAAAALGELWRLDDLELELRELGDVGYYELRSRRVFFDRPVAASARGVAEDEIAALTYMVNAMRRVDGTGETVPYSLVTALSDPSILPGDAMKLGEDEILINRWLADELGLKAGDRMKGAYFVTTRGRKLEEVWHEFKVAGVIPLAGLAADQQWMPPFPDVPDTETLDDWTPSFDRKYAIRSADDDYWELYKGTPKGFISLETGQAVWANRFGELTTIRYPMASHSMDELRGKLREAIDPGAVGFVFTDVRTPALQASENALDFGQLFLGFSFFLIAAALLLMGMLFAFGVEQRTGELGLLLATGWRPGSVRRLLLGEGAAMAAVGVGLGVAGGLAYTQAVLWALGRVWSDLPGASSVAFHATTGSLLIGALGSFVVAMATVWLFVRREAKRPAQELLASSVGVAGSGAVSRPVRGWRAKIGWALAIVGFLGTIGIVVYASGQGAREAAGAFFGAGALLLTGALGLCWGLLVKLSRERRNEDEAKAAAQHMTLGRMGVSGSGRRRGRSLATISLLAFGCFMVVGTHAYKKDALVEADDPATGTGGFAFYAELTAPVLYDMNTADGRRKLGIDEAAWGEAGAVQFRVREGDEASCLNLNRAQTPHLWGVDPAKLKGRFTFTKAMDEVEVEDGWSMLSHEFEDGAIPAVADQGSLQWALKGDVGMELEYTDGAGRPVKVRILGAIASSVLQGRLVISEKHFERLYPDTSGYKALLVDAPPGQREAVRETMAFALGDSGIQLVSAADRLQQFNAVENTYLAIFQVLGYLGLLLGSLGLGIVVARNILERRGELALLQAIGFRKPSLQWLVMSEHWLLLLAGLISGVVAAVLSVLPSIMEPGRTVPYGLMSATLVGVLVMGVLWVWLATKATLRGGVLDALREE